MTIFDLTLDIHKFCLIEDLARGLVSSEMKCDASYVVDRTMNLTWSAGSQAPMKCGTSTWVSPASPSPLFLFQTTDLKQHSDIWSKSGFDIYMYGIYPGWLIDWYFHFAIDFEDFQIITPDPFQLGNVN